MPSTPKKILLFTNPIAGRGRGLAVAAALSTALSDAGYLVESPKGPPATATWAPGLPPIAALVIGGDGTLRSAVERLLAVSPICPPILPISMGTANLMAKHLGLRWSPRAIVPAVLDLLRHGQIKHLDAGRANGQLFLLMVGVGLDAEVVHLLDSARTGPINLASYVIPIARALAGYRFPSLSVWIDGQLVLDNIPALAFVGNVKEYGTGIPVLTKARSDDGLLDACILPCRNPMQLAEWLLALPTGDHTSREGTIYTQCRSVRVESSVPVPVQMDGDPAGFTPLATEIIPDRIPFLVHPPVAFANPKTVTNPKSRIQRLDSTASVGSIQHLRAVSSVG